MSAAAPLRVAIAGGSGYAGGEFLRLALFHPDLEVTQVTSERQAGRPVSMVHPNLRSVTRARFVRSAGLEEADVLVSALPHGAFVERVDEFAALAPRLIDLSSDMRLRDPEAYQHAYGRPHPRPNLLGSFVYGVPELSREALPGATRIAGAGCLATAGALATWPLVRHGLLARRDVIIDAKIGSSAAGAKSGPAGHHPERAGAVRTYAPTGHRHQREIEQVLGGGVNVHLSATAIERVRGVLAAVHGFIPDGTSERDVLAAFQDAYEDAPFVRIVQARRGIHRVPDPKILDGTNWCDVGFELDAATGRVVVMSAIDNLVKGTAGQALQALNLAMGWDETLGLAFPGLHP
ncbi:MAG: N-acetyl-gamma-glutamyl-phosphate reductase [Trueperaceae bacterium]|nr:N-acetyl-gamma-glutamyl-phosphate reductase [Trueperaceae bacterium]